MLKHLKLKKQRRMEKKMRKLRNGLNSARGDLNGGNNSNGDNQTDNDLKNLNLITQAKQATTTLKHRKRLSTDSTASEASLKVSKLDLIDCSQAHQQQHAKMLVAPISNRNSSSSSPPMIVCLGVNADANIDSENEIELGEVVRVDKIKDKVGFNELARDYASGDALTPDPSPRPSTPVGLLAKSK